MAGLPLIRGSRRHAALALLFGLAMAGPGDAQVRYKDADGVTHWVDSIDKVPPQFRPGATGQPSPGPGAGPRPSPRSDTPSGGGNDARRAFLGRCKFYYMVGRIPPDCRGIPLSEMANVPMIDPSTGREVK